MNLKSVYRWSPLLAMPLLIAGCPSVTGGGVGCGDCEYDDPVACYEEEPTDGGVGEPCVDVCPSGECASGCTRANDGSNGACSGARSPSCTGWDPDNQVTYANGVYSMDTVYAEGVLSDLRPLWGCDGISVSYANPGFEIDGADSGDLLYELGLRDGDVLLSINGYSLATESLAAYAYFVLWVIQAEGSYELDIERSSVPMTFYYELVIPMIPGP